jgi:hypothetical protein
LQFKTSLGKQFTRPPSSKITKAKWTGGVAQTAEHLLCKCKALSSNPSPKQDEKKELHQMISLFISSGDKHIIISANYLT